MTPTRPKSAGRRAAPPLDTTPPPSALPIDVDTAAALELAMQLMAIDGGSGHEAGVATLVRETLLAAGAAQSALVFDQAHLKTPIAGEVGNLILRLPGTVKGPARLLMAHMDTVPICRGAKPVRKGDYVRSADPHTGLGADDRAGVAVILATAQAILRHNLPHPPLAFLFAIQEEVGLYGARFVDRKLLGKPALAFNWDGGVANKVTIGATGGYRLDITIDGLAAHAGGAPEHGISAIAIASLAIADLVRGGWHGLIARGSKRGTSNVGVIHGGDATNVVTDRLAIRAEARSHFPAFRERIVREYQRAFARAVKLVKNVAGAQGKVTFEGRLDYEAFRLSPDEASVAAAQAAIRAEGLEPELNISNGGLDANWMFAHGIPTVTMGCGQDNIHTTNERLEIPEFERACRIALRLALG